MSRKSFKDNTANIDRFFTDPEFQQQTVEAVKAKYKTTGMSKTAKKSKKSKEPYRMTLRLRPTYKEYLDQVSWKTRKNITEYINDLIQADMEK